MSKVYEIITNQILDKLEQGVAPWSKPWVMNGKEHKNLISKKPYRGINPFMLDLTVMDEGYESNYWVTYKQAKKLGGHVRKGETGTLIVFWKWVEKEDESGDVSRFPILRYYKVFNTEQCDFPADFQIPNDEAELPNNYSPIAEAENIISNMPKRPEIRHHGNRAYYRPSIDDVTMPNESQFKGSEEYYSTLFHELAHATGHASRLGRFHKNHNHSFG